MTVATCGDPACDLAFDHHHELWTAPNGESREAIIAHAADPRAEVRDPDSGEVIFPAVKGPLRIVGGTDQ